MTPSKEVVRAILSIHILIDRRIIELGYRSGKIPPSGYGTIDCTYDLSIDEMKGLRDFIDAKLKERTARPHQKEVIDAAAVSFADENDERDWDRLDIWSAKYHAFIAGDTNGYSRAMERISALEKALGLAVTAHKINADEDYRGNRSVESVRSFKVLAMIDQALKET